MYFNIHLVKVLAYNSSYHNSSFMSHDVIDFQILVSLVCTTFIKKPISLFLMVPFMKTLLHILLK
jgi:hypothetical protein